MYMQGVESLGTRLYIIERIYTVTRDLWTIPLAPACRDQELAWAPHEDSAGWSAVELTTARLAWCPLPCREPETQGTGSWLSSSPWTSCSEGARIRVLSKYFYVLVANFGNDGEHSCVVCIMHESSPTGQEPLENRVLRSLRLLLFARIKLDKIAKTHCTQI